MRSFRTKLFLVYSLTLIALMLSVSFPMYFYFKKSIERNIITSVEQLTGSVASNLSSQLNMFDNMSFLLYNSYDQTRSTLADYLMLKREAANTKADLEARKSINNFMLISINAYKSIDRLNLYTADGELFSKQAAFTPSAVPGGFSDFYDEADEAKGGPILLAGGAPPSFSLIRKLQWEGRGLGYLEAVLKPNAIVDQEKAGNMPGASVFILRQGRVVYSSEGSMAVESLPESLISDKKNPLQEQGVFAVKQATDFPAFSVVTAVPEKQLFAPLLIFRNVMILSVLLLIAVSVAFYYFLAKLLSRPITSLKQVMDAVKLDDDQQEVHIENKYRMNEIESLRRSFQKMNDRIKLAMEDKLRFRTLQLQSHFQTLQAQINPHFLFNMLGVIAIMADKEGSGSGSAAVISRKLSRFLRYAVSTDSLSASLREELDFTENYLNLMKFRYLHRLEYRFDVPAEIMELTVPKLTVQPIVENCLQHGFGNDIKRMRIEVLGRLERDRWELEIRDNGRGFPDGSLRELQRTIEDYMNRLQTSQPEAPPALELGGMGLTSALVRLRLSRRAGFSYDVGNAPEGGARVILRGALISRLEEL
ncbi:sensor histidine kinase [Cohnella hongkongensis]|uniref:Sensor histidine kinase n=1 Tax=Cohnella hongkongensis TaxID=178337 RepID=A0ABV9FI47_9BACL